MWGLGNIGSCELEIDVDLVHVRRPSVFCVVKFMPIFEISGDKNKLRSCQHCQNIKTPHTSEAQIPLRHSGGSRISQRRATNSRGGCANLLLPTAREGNVFTRICDSVHNQPNGYSVTAYPCWLLGHYACYWNAFLFCKMFAESCMKMNKFGLRRGACIPSIPSFNLQINRYEKHGKELY